MKWHANYQAKKGKDLGNKGVIESAKSSPNSMSSFQADMFALSIHLMAVTVPICHVIFGHDSGVPRITIEYLINHISIGALRGTCIQRRKTWKWSINYFETSTV